MPTLPLRTKKNHGFVLNVKDNIMGISIKENYKINNLVGYILCPHGRPDEVDSMVNIYQQLRSHIQNVGTSRFIYLNPQLINQI